MANVSEYIKESYIELTEKVTWPTWRELQSSAIAGIGSNHYYRFGSFWYGSGDSVSCLNKFL